MRAPRLRTRNAGPLKVFADAMQRPTLADDLFAHVGRRAGCTLDDDIDCCEGLEERHEDAQERC
jgi:hypothetical protein